jgi:hypothetical protein
MSIASLTKALDNFGLNDLLLRDFMLAQKDTELAELEMQMSQHRARIEAQKEQICAEFEQRASDLKLIVQGNA